MEASTSGIDCNLDETSGNLVNLFFINEDNDVDVDDDIFVNDIFCSDGEETDRYKLSNDEIEDRIFGDGDEDTDPYADEEDEPVEPVSKKKKTYKVILSHKNLILDVGRKVIIRHWNHYQPSDENAPGGNFDVPPDANELFFFNKFTSDAVIQDMTYQTNLYAEQFFEKNMHKLTEKSRLKRFIGGISEDKIKLFLCLIFYMGLVKKNDVKDYWSTDVILSTPFVRTLMSRDEYHNTLTFFHLTDNSIYPSKGSDDYNPRKMLGNLFTSLTTPSAHFY